MSERVRTAPMVGCRSVAKGPGSSRGGVSILLARHGEVAPNRIQRYSGRSTEPLTAAGRQQACNLARFLKERTLTRIRSSQIARGEQTAGLVGDYLGVPVLLDERLNELRMGPWEGLTETEVAARYPLDLTRSPCSGSWRPWCGSASAPQHLHDHVLVRSANCAGSEQGRVGEPRGPVLVSR